MSLAEMMEAWERMHAAWPEHYTEDSFMDDMLTIADFIRSAAEQGYELYRPLDTGQSSE